MEKWIDHKIESESYTETIHHQGYDVYPFPNSYNYTNVETLDLSDVLTTYTGQWFLGLEFGLEYQYHSSSNFVLGFSAAVEMDLERTKLEYEDFNYNFFPHLGVSVGYCIW